MKKIVIIILLSLMLCGCDNDKADNEVTEAERYVITGEIIEIQDDNLLLIEITKERGGYQIEDKVLVKYTELLCVDISGEEETFEVVEPKVGDEVSVEFAGDNKSNNQGLDYIEIEQIYKY